MAAYCCIMGLSLMLILTAELLPRVTVVFWKNGERGVRGRAGNRRRREAESREEETHPAALIDPVTEPPMAEGRASHIQDKQGHNQQAGGGATTC